LDKQFVKQNKVAGVIKSDDVRVAQLLSDVFIADLDAIYETSSCST